MDEVLCRQTKISDTLSVICGDSFLYMKAFNII